MELTQEEKEMMEKLKTQKCVVLQDEKSYDYYEGFYDGIQAILKIIKGA